MQFQSLVSLWFGLTLPAIVLMYLLKRKYVDTEVPSHLLWNRVLRSLEANRPWQRLRNQLLLILQLLTAALLVLALMQPWIWAESGAKGHLVLVLDRSASMDALTPDPEHSKEKLTRLELAKRKAADVVKGGANGSAVTVISMGSQPEVLVSRETTADTVLAAIAGIEPFYGRTAYKETMSLAAALTQDDTDAEIRVLTDAVWSEGTEGLTFRVPVRVEPVGANPANNVAIVQFGVRNGADAAGGSAVSGVAALKNTGSGKLDTDVTLYAGTSAAETVRIQLEPGEQRTLHFDNIRSSEYYKLSVDAEDDYAADNQAYAFLSGERNRRVLLLTEGNLFLEKALQLARAEVIKVQAAGMAAPPQGDFDLVVADRLASGAAAGEAWQRLFREKPLWSIRSGYQGEEVRPPQADYRIGEHPVTKYIRFQDTHIAKLLPIDPKDLAAWGQPVVSAGSQPLIVAGMENGRPRLLFTFDLQQSDLPLRPEFPILVQNAVDWLGSAQSASLGRVIAGEKTDIPIVAQTVSAHWVPMELAGSAAGELQAAGQSYLPAEQADGAVLSRQSVPNRPGLYQFVEKGEDGSERKTLLEVSADPGESAIGERRELSFTSASSSPPATEQGGAQALTEEREGESPYPLLPWIIGLVMLIVLAEWGVYHRGNSIS
ncbi:MULTISPECIES: VWA domain-containing protein [unclassified Paenibacillus]|uniref:vWA domain-containing protein n=2 Tax=Paenibacillus TaxID=44249 RepID=UPI0021186071|nr:MULTISPECIES: VWA domain-containing protein [unclassified Paenibacillus]